VKVAVVKIREVGVAGTEWPVHVGVAVRLPGWSPRVVCVLVMLVVNVYVRVLEHLVVVLMIGPLGQMKPHAGPHEAAG